MWLATHPDEAVRMRAHFGDIHENGVLFDTPLFVKNLESCLKDLTHAL